MFIWNYGIIRKFCFEIVKFVMFTKIGSKFHQPYKYKIKEMLEYTNKQQALGSHLRNAARSLRVASLWKMLSNYRVGHK